MPREAEHAGGSPLLGARREGVRQDLPSRHLFVGRRHDESSASGAPSYGISPARGTHRPPRSPTRSGAIPTITQPARAPPEIDQTGGALTVWAGGGGATLSSTCFASASSFLCVCANSISSCVTSTRSAFAMKMRRRKLELLFELFVGAP